MSEYIDPMRVSAEQLQAERDAIDVTHQPSPWLQTGAEANTTYEPLDSATKSMSAEEYARMQDALEAYAHDQDRD
jgi:hypothetical protein